MWSPIAGPGRSGRRLSLLPFALAAMLHIAEGSAQPGESIARLPGQLAISESLSLTAVLEAALANAPAARSEQNLRATADAFAAFGDSWIAGRSSLQLSYYDDSPLDDVGLRELESGLTLSLWRPGERNDTAVLGENHAAEFETWQAYLRLQVAGQLRAVLADMAVAEALLEIARQATADAQRLMTLTEAMEQAGAAAQADVLQARTQLLERQRMELRAVTDLATAEQFYTVLTGLDIRPAEPLQETASSAVTVPPAHPALRYLQSQVEIAAANVSLTRHQANGRPNVSLGMRRERGDRLQPYTDSLAISLSLPIGKNPGAAASVSLARGEQVDAEVQLIEARRQLERQLVAVRQEAELVDRSLELSEQQATLTRQRYDMALAAFEVGEMDLIEVVIAQQQSREAQLNYETLRLRQLRLNSEHNQIIGVLP